MLCWAQIPLAGNFMSRLKFKQKSCCQNPSMDNAVITDCTMKYIMFLNLKPACYTTGNSWVRYISIIPTQCFYCFFGDFDWSVGNIKLFLHFDKNPYVGIFDNCLDFTVLDCVDNNDLYRKLYYFYQIKYS